MNTKDIKSVLEDGFNKILPLEDILNGHSNQKYRQRTNAVWDNKEIFAKHIKNSVN